MYGGEFWCIALYILYKVNVCILSLAAKVNPGEAGSTTVNEEKYLSLNTYGALYDRTSEKVLEKYSLSHEYNDMALQKIIYIWYHVLHWYVTCQVLNMLIISPVNREIFVPIILVFWARVIKLLIQCTVSLMDILIHDINTIPLERYR